MKNLKLKKLKIKRVKLPSKISNPLRKGSITVDKVNEAIKSVSNITNDTVSDHREDILSTARKFIYPLQHSKHKFVRLSVGIALIVLVSFFAYCSIELYALQTTSGFLYRVTEVIPFPVAKEGGRWISYNSYLFELRRNMHYYITQQQASFSTKDGKNQLTTLKQQAMKRVVNDSYVSTLADKNDIKVSGIEISSAISTVRQQNKLGNSDQVLSNVLNEYWGWNINDFRRELGIELLSQKVATKLDANTTNQANSVVSLLNSGQDFASVASKYSQDSSTASNGGQYGSDITLNNPNISPIVINKLFSMQPGQVSGVINSGTNLEILKLISKTGNSVKAAHIQFNIQPIANYTQSLKSSNKPSIFINVSLN